VVSIKLATQLAAARAFIMLTLRPTGLSSSAYQDWLDYLVVEDGRDVGRLYEDRHSPSICVGFGRSVYRIDLVGEPAGTACQGWHQLQCSETIAALRAIGIRT
jgi:hypothetical protein